MKVLPPRITLGVALLLCIAIATCSSILYMSYIAGSASYTEIAEPSTTDERRSQLAEGVARAREVQMALTNAIWWLALLTGLIVAATLLWPFKRKQPG